MDKLIYKPEVRGMIRSVIKHLKQNEDVNIETKVIDYHGHSCSVCGKKFNVYNGFVDKVKSIDAYTTSDGVSYLLPLCGKCSQIIGKADSDLKSKAIEEFIANL